MAVPIAAIFVGIGVLLLAMRILHLASRASTPVLEYNRSEFNDTVLKNCPLLHEPYVPPLLWGKSGHLQTLLYSKMGRINSPFPRGQRYYESMPDGATMTYDVFEPQVPHPYGGDFTMLICPGIANSSESLYICTCVHYAQLHGFRVAVLNHLGALKDEPLTAPRMFTYGNTEEYGVMVDRIRQQYPDTYCIAVGFSMGGNIVTKYLGLSEENQNKFIFAISCCQGYDAGVAVHEGMNWDHLGRIYMFVMAHHQKSLLRFHAKALLDDDTVEEHDLNTERIFGATSLLEFDELYSRRRAGFSNLDDYYHEASCRWVIDKIHIPMFIMNSYDDPLIPESVLHVPRTFASRRKNVIFATTRHGGHLGYFEGAFTSVDTITWLDKMVVQYANAAILASAYKLGLTVKT